jgi:hypothetical protein
MAVVPTPLLTLPLPRSCTMVDAATEAVCCHMMLTSTKTDEMKTVARAAWDTGLDGKGLTSVSDPLAEVSVCQPGKVASRRNVRKARTMATMLITEGKYIVSKKYSQREM